MDSILGIGLPELLVILLLAGMVMGPQRIRTVARSLGRITAQLQGISREFARQLNAELDALEGDEVKNTVQDMRSLKDEVEALRRELREVPRSFAKEGKEVVRESQAAFKGEPLHGSDENGEPPAGDEPADDGPVDDGPAEVPRRLPKPIDVPEDPE